MSSYRRHLLGLLCAGAAGCAPTKMQSPPADALLPPEDRPPLAQTHEVKDNYFGRTIVDPYRWMETPGSPELRSWLTIQNSYTRDVLEKRPLFSELKDRILELSRTVREVREARLTSKSIIFLDRSEGREKPTLQVRDADGQTLILVDIEKSSETNIDYFYPSPRGTYVVYGLSKGGTEDSDLHVLDVASGREELPPIQGCRWPTVSWLPDESAFYYTREPERPESSSPNEADMDLRIHLHTMGTPVERDRIVFGYGVPGSDIADRAVLPTVLVDSDPQLRLAVFDHGVLDPLTIAVASDAGKDRPPRWRKIAGPDEQIKRAVLRSRSLYVLTSKDAPLNRLEQWTVGPSGIVERKALFESSTAILTDFVAATDGLYASAIEQGLARLFFVPYGDQKPQAIHLPMEGQLTSLNALPGSVGALFRIEGWTSSPRWLLQTSKGVEDTGLGGAKIDLDDVVVEHLQVPSHDGVMIPLTVLHRKNFEPNGHNPTWLGAYGSYGIPLAPNFRPTRKAWLERGGVFAFAHVRGGGELGEPWHKAGQKKLKANSILDFIACAEELIRRRIASPQTLAAFGQSAGGIVANGAIVRRPDLFGAAVVDVGDANMLRLEEEPGGPQNAEEFGSIKTEEGFESLLSMDAYHQVQDRTRYPAMLFSTGINDPRVPPWQTAKMAARLQAATDSNEPILVRVGFDEGHGVGALRHQEAERTASFFTFLFWQLGKPSETSVSALESR